MKDLRKYATVSSVQTTISSGLDACTELRISATAVDDARRTLAPTRTYRAVAELFGALADPTRVTIVHALSLRDHCTCELAEIVGVTESAISQHLRILRALRLVRARREGKYVFYSLDDVHVSALLKLGLASNGHNDRVDAGVPA